MKINMAQLNLTSKLAVELMSNSVELSLAQQKCDVSIRLMAIKISFPTCLWWWQKGKFGILCGLSFAMLLCPTFLPRKNFKNNNYSMLF